MQLDPLFVDPIGRISEKPKTFCHGITDNPLLFSGQFLFLKKILHGDDILYDIHASYILSLSQVAEGLYRRQPKELQDSYNIPYNISSHDEYLGVLLLSQVFYETNIAQEIVEYGEYWRWQYNDFAPYNSFFDYLQNDFFGAIKGLILYIKDYRNNPQDTNSVSLRHHPAICSLNFYRLPRDRAIYKIMAGCRVSLLESIWLALSTVVATRRDIYDGSRGGTLLLIWFRVLLFKYSNKRVPLLVKGAHYLFNKILNIRFGTRFASKIADLYFDLKGDNGERHPTIQLIKEWEDINVN